MMSKRAACYIRVSTDEQVEYSPDSQIREMREFAQKNDITILEDFIFIDEGISGRKASGRPGFQEMIAQAKQKPKPFDIVLLYKFSRFARNREDSVVYKSLLRKKCEIDVISITEPLDSENKMSIIMEAFIEAMDEYYCVNLSEDVRRTMTEKALRGELQTSPPYGYYADKESNRLNIAQDEAKIIQKIFNDFICGHSCFSIAKELNIQGVRTHFGNCFESRTIKYILQNPVYIGKLRWNPNGRTKWDFSNPNLIITDSQHPAIITLNTWEIAQAQLSLQKARNQKYKKPQAIHQDWLSGLIRCYECGGTLIKTGNYWRCGNYAKGKCNTSQNIPDNQLKNAVIEQIKIDVDHVCAMPFIHVTQERISKNLFPLKNSLLQLNKRLNRAKEAYLNGIDTLKEYQKSKKIIEAEIAHLEASTEASPQNSRSEKHSDLKDRLEPVHIILTSQAYSLAQKHQIAHTIIQFGILDRKKGILELTYQMVL